MITFEDVLEENSDMIYYSVNTVWWTHDSNDITLGPVVFSVPSYPGLPLDIFGSPLFQTGKVKEFLDKTLIENCESYGENRLRNFMFSHAKNIRLVTNKMPKNSFELVKNVKLFCEFCDREMK